MRNWNVLVVATMLAFNTAVADVTEIELAAEEFSGVVVQSGRVLVAGQPTRQGLADVANRGVRTVVNLRTPEEMAAQEFDESAQVAELDMNYVQIPSGGPRYPYSRATLQEFADVMENAEGQVLLHCKSATRASHLWVAYLVKYKDIPLDEALEIGRSIHFGTLPIEGYLPGEFEYRYSPDTE